MLFKSVLWHISNRQHLGSPAQGDSHAPTMGPVRPSYLHPGELLDSSPALIWCQRLVIQKPPRRILFRAPWPHGDGEETESTPEHTIPLLSCRIVQATWSNTNSPGKLLQSTPKSDQSCFIFCPPTLQCALIPTAVSLWFLPHHTSALGHSSQILPVFPGSVHGPPVSMVLSICIITYCPDHRNHYQPLWESFLAPAKVIKKQELEVFWYLLS